MKLNRWFGLATATLMVFGAGSMLAQNNGNGGPGGGGPGGGRGWRNMDPAQRQQMMMDGVKSELEITDDSEWNALQPLVKKVMDAQQAVVGERIRGFFGRPPRGGDNNGGDQGSRRGGGGGMFGTPSPEAEALQRAVDSKASSAETKTALAKLVEARKNNQANLEKAQADLRKVLTVRQEAILTLRGLL